MDRETSGEGLPELDIQIDEIPDLLKTTDQFDLAQDAFLEACHEHAASPCDETNEAVAESGNEVITSFKSSVETICSTLDREESVRAITTLMVNDQMERAKLLMTLAPSRKLGVYDEKTLHEILEGYYNESDGVDEFAKKVVDSFAGIMQKEVNIFTKKVYKRYLALQALTTTVTIASEPLELPDDSELPQSGMCYAFSIEPPIGVYDPQFIENAKITFSTSDATYGHIWVKTDDANEGQSPEEADENTHADMFDRFNRALNPLGVAALQVIWRRNFSDQEDAGDSEEYED